MSGRQLLDMVINVTACVIIAGTVAVAVLVAAALWVMW